MSDPLDPVQNIERFITEEVLPDFILIKKKYPKFSTDEVLRAVAFHWNMGEYIPYDRNNTSYLALYDKYVLIYKSLVMGDTWPKIAMAKKQRSW